MSNTTTTTDTDTATEPTTCAMCGSAGNRYRGKWLMCFMCYADSVE